MTKEPTVADWHLQEHDGTATQAMLEELADLYVEVYSEQSHSDDSIHRRESFLERTSRQADRPGFRLITAHTESSDEVIGYSFGFPFETGQWWRGAFDSPEHVVQANKFAVIELILRATWRGHELGRTLMDQLLAGYEGQYATLLARPDTPARSMYARWGWNGSPRCNQLRTR